MQVVLHHEHSPMKPSSPKHSLPYRVPTVVPLHLPSFLLCECPVLTLFHLLSFEPQVWQKVEHVHSKAIMMEGIRVKRHNKRSPVNEGVSDSKVEFPYDAFLSLSCTAQIRTPNAEPDHRLAPVLIWPWLAPAIQGFRRSIFSTLPGDTRVWIRDLQAE